MAARSTNGYCWTSTLLPRTTEALITDLPEEKPAAAPAMPHGDF
jgi:hypothetical protein